LRIVVGWQFRLSAGVISPVVVNILCYNKLVYLPSYYHLTVPKSIGLSTAINLTKLFNSFASPHFLINFAWSHTACSPAFETTPANPSQTGNLRECKKKI